MGLVEKANEIQKLVEEKFSEGYSSSGCEYDHRNQSCSGDSPVHTKG